VLTAVFSAVKYREIHLSTTIRVMVFSLCVSQGVAGLGALGPESVRDFSPIR
jgi:hypothetical protein